MGSRLSDEVNRFTSPTDVDAKNKVERKQHNCASAVTAVCVTLKNVKNLSQFSAFFWTFIIIISGFLFLFSHLVFLRLLASHSLFFSSPSSFREILEFFFASRNGFLSRSLLMMGSESKMCFVFNVCCKERRRRRQHKNTWCFDFSRHHFVFLWWCRNVLSRWQKKRNYGAI